MTWLTDTRDALADITGVTTCRIGWESNISPADWPLIRITPERITPGRPYGGRTGSVLIYLGMPITEAEGLEEVYEQLLELEAEVLLVLQTIGARYIETVAEPDEPTTYKRLAIRAEIQTAEQIPVRCAMFCTSDTITASGTPAAIAPFTTLVNEDLAADWTPDLTAGTITRELNGAASTLTKVTATGSVAGPVAAEVQVGIYADGALIGNRALVLTTGPTASVAWTVETTHSATGAIAFSVRAAGDAEDFVFSGVRLTAQRVAG